MPLAIFMIGTGILLLHAIAVPGQAGALVAWGWHNLDQVGDTPTGNDFEAVSAGYCHSVALRSDSSLIAWGSDQGGQVSGAPAGHDFAAIAAGSPNVAIRTTAISAVLGDMNWDGFVSIIGDVPPFVQMVYFGNDA